MLVHVRADHRFGLGGENAREIVVVKDVAGNIDAFSRFQIGMDYLDAARFERCEHEFVHIWLLLFAERFGRGAEIERGRYVLRFEPRKRFAQPCGVTFHHGGARPRCG